MSESLRQYAPSVGERRAIQGYDSQYALAAETALKFAATGRLKCVRLVDPRAHNADDFQIVTEERVDAWQVKWGGKPSAFCFREFSNLFSDLAQSLRQLREENGTVSVVIHVATNGLASTSDQIKDDTGATIGDFHDFCRDVLRPSDHLEEGESDVLSKWATTIQELAKGADLKVAETLDVLAHLRMRTGLKLAGEDLDSDGLPASSIDPRDIQAVKACLLRFVRESTDRTKAVEIPADELLAAAGLEYRLELRNTHRFPSPDIEYRPLVAARDQLQAFLTSGQSGYVALVGPPGSGKSTLISEEFTEPGLRILRYYSFLPGTGLDRGSRGEAQHFFQDMNMSLRRVGSHAASGFAKSRAEQRAEFLRHLAWLNSDSQKTGRRTVLFIDGIDHVPREQRPERSFLLDLPLPTEIPSGVIVALGTQTTDIPDLPLAVRRELESPGRRIEISRLSQQQVREITAAEFPEESETFWALSNRLFELSEGHPLSLAVLIRRARSSAESPLAALSDLATFQTDINGYYRSIWDVEEPDETLFEFLGMACRDRRPVDVRAAERVLGRDRLTRYLRQFGHVWQRDAAGHLHVFHNSFRLFLRQKTACDVFDNYDKSRHIEFHRRLAEQYAVNEDPILQWEAVYHFCEAGQPGDGLRLVTPEAVRRQLRCFRQPAPLFADLRVALRLALEMQKLPKVAEIALAWNELNLHDYVVDAEFDRLARELLKAGQHEYALRLMTDGRTITLAPAVCLDAASDLARAGHAASARELFLAAEPLAALHTLDGSDQQKQIEDLKTWAKVASRFRRPEQVLHLIRTAALQGLHDRSEGEPEKQLRNQLCIELAIGLCESSPDCSVIDEIDGQLLVADRSAWLDLQVGRINVLGSRNEQSGRLAQRVVDEFQAAEIETLSEWNRLRISEIALLDVEEQGGARRLIEGLSEPRTRGYTRLGELSATHWYWFRIARIRALLDEPLDLDRELPLRDVEGKQHTNQLAVRYIALMGSLAGQRRRDSVSVPELMRDVRTMFRFLSQRFGSGFHDDSFRDVRELRPAIIELVLTRVANDESFDEVAALIIELLLDESGHQNWSIYERVGGLRELLNAGGPRDACFRILQSIENAWADDPDASSQIDRSLTLASLWNRLGDHGMAMTFLKEVMPQAGTVGHDNDEQINVWCEVLSEANRIDTDEFAKRRRLELMVHGALAASGTSAPSGRAAEVALRDVSQSNAAEGLRLVSLFSDNGVLSFADAVGAFLAGLQRSNPDVGPLAFAVASEILLPLDEPGTDLVDALADSPDVASKWSELGLNVDVMSLPENRWGWHRGIVDASSTHGLPIPAPSQAAADRQQEARTQATSTIELSSDEKVSVDQLCQQIQSPDDFRRFREEASTRSWISTKPLTAELCRRWDGESVAELAATIQVYDRVGDELMLCIDRLDALGQSDAAAAFARYVLANCGIGYGEDWNSHGALLRAATLLERHTARESFRSEMMKFLIDYLTRERGSFSRNGTELFRDVFPRICTNDELLSIADHVEEFLAHLSQRLLRDTTWHCSAVPSHEAGLTLLSECLAHPVTVISHGARRAVLRLLRSSQLSPVDVEFLCRSACDHPGRIQGQLTAFRSVVADVPEAIRPVIPWLRETASINHLGFRNECRLILAELGETIGSPTGAHPELLRNFVHRPIQRESTIFDEVESTTASLPDAYDARSFAAHVMPEIMCVARAAGLDSDLVLRRVYEICTSQFEGSSTRAAEDDLRMRLANARLKHGYQRPRAFALEHAIHQAAAELVDAGKIDDDWAERLVLVLPGADPLLLRIEPTAIPVEIPSFEPPDPFDKEKQQQWILECVPGQGVIESLLCREVEDGLVVLAESTCFSAGRPTLHEYRQSNLCCGQSAELTDGPVLPQSTRTFATQYDTAKSVEPAIAVQRPLTFGSGTPHEEWVAFNAGLAISAGFRPDSSKLFGWSDGHDQIWVIRWLSGSPLVIPRQDVRGDGWLLIGTSGVIEKLRRHFGSITRRCFVARGGIADEQDPVCYWVEAVCRTKNQP